MFPCDAYNQPVQCATQGPVWDLTVLLLRLRHLSDIGSVWQKDEKCALKKQREKLHISWTWHILYCAFRIMQILIILLVSLDVLFSVDHCTTRVTFYIPWNDLISFLLFPFLSCECQLFCFLPFFHHNLSLFSCCIFRWSPSSINSGSRLWLTLDVIPIHLIYLHTYAKAALLLYECLLPYIITLTTIIPFPILAHLFDRIFLKIGFL